MGRAVGGATLAVVLAAAGLVLPAVNAGAAPMVTPLGNFGYGMVTTTPNGYAYVANYNLGEVYQVAPNGTVTPFAAVHNAWAITSDAAGNLYVDDFYGCAIDEVSPSGAVTTYSSSEGACYLYGMVVDPTSGVLYVSNASGDIYAVATNGAFSFFASGAGGYGLARDTSGNLYSANPESGTILKIDSLGSVTTFATGVGSPLGVAMGPSGILYVAEDDGNNIYQVTPSGAVSVFVPASLLTPNDEVASLAVSPSGVMYVVDWGTYEVWQIGAVSAPAGLSVSSLNESYGGSLHQTVSATWQGVPGVAAYTCTLMYGFGLASSFTTTTTNTTCSFPGLSLGTTYGIEVAAGSAGALGPASVAFATPAPVPAAPKAPVKRTIVCQKNHSQRIRVITRVAPRCPSGWHRIA